MNHPNRRMRSITLATAAVICGASTVGIWSSAAMANEDTARQVAEDVSALASAPDAGDVLPAEVNAELLGLGGLNPDSSRLAGVDAQGRQFFIATDGAGNLCLVMVDKKAQTTGSACSAPDQLESQPLAMSSWNYMTGGVEAFYVTDEFAEARLGGGWNFVAPNLIVLDDEEVTSSTIRLGGADGGIELRRFPADEVKGAPAGDTQ